ncbi:MAG: Mannosylfructose-phosphate synthase [Spirochaetes bacterium ADurb.Bin110]|nr:MAG: Mannosylfructose-phosphate synthase [Spirochaetes bacterium ADurb.Bin110]
MIKQKYGIPFLITEHSSGFKRNLIGNKELIFAKRVFRIAEKRIAVSKQFADYLYSITDKYFIYLPNMTDTEYFTIINNKSKSSDFVFLNIASLDNNKNHYMLIEAFAEKFKDINHVKLIIAGKGPLESKLKAKIIDLNIEKKVVFKGQVSREQVRELFHNANAFVLSSKYETFGVVLIEALSCGLPIIATKCGGAESIIADERIGELVDIDKEDLANAMEKVFNNINKYDSAYIREYAINSFSKEVVTSKLIELYKIILLSKKNHDNIGNTI